jgi:hypothetical protein
MSIDRRFAVWRKATTLALWVPYGAPWEPGQDHVRMFIAQSYPGPSAAADYYDWPFSLDGFGTGPSEYDQSSDEVYCPCGAILPAWDGTVGDLLRMIYQHCADMRHPTPRLEQ